MKRLCSFINHLLGNTEKKSPVSSPEATSAKQPSNSSNPNSSTNSTETSEDRTCPSPKDVMSALGVEVLEDGGDDFYLVGFQGGVFVFNFSKGCLTVMYNDIAECSFSEAVQASIVANDINGEYSVWSCYLRTSTDEKVKKPVKVCMSQLFLLNAPLKQSLDFIHSVLMNAFTVARDFRERFKEALSQDSSIDSVLNQKDFVHKMNLTKRMMEVGNWNQLHDERPEASLLSMKSLTGLFDDSEFGALQSLQVLANDQVKKITESDKMEKFDIRSYIRNYPDYMNVDLWTIVASFEIQNLIISLAKIPGSSPKSLFYVMNVMRTGVEADRFIKNHSIVSVRTTVEIRLTTKQEDYWEVKYMVDEAKEKLSKDKVSELTNEQRLLLVEAQPSLQADMYWGMKFFNRNCLFQSLYHFRRLYFNLLNSESKSEEDMSCISEVSLYIGLIFSKMKMYDRAYYYLDKARGLESIFSAECLINCMCNLKDSYVISYIQNLMGVVLKRLDEKEDTEKYYEFYLFLKRHMVDALLFERRLDEVTEFLQQMLENDEDPTFAQAKLDEVEKIRKASEKDETKQNNKN